MESADDEILLESTRILSSVNRANPNFALAYTGIADCYHSLQQRNILSVDEAFLKAEPAARKALELDPTLAEAYASMAMVSFLYYADWTDAEARYRRAIKPQLCRSPRPLRDAAKCLGQI